MWPLTGLQTTGTFLVEVSEVFPEPLIILRYHHWSLIAELLPPGSGDWRSNTSSTSPDSWKEPGLDLYAHWVETNYELMFRKKESSRLKIADLL